MKRLTLALIAATPASLAAEEPLVLDEILITGGLTPIGSAETGRAHTIITSEQLEAQGMRYVSEALRQVPGLAVSRTGSNGGFTQIRVRGAEANQVLVLVDGLEISPAGNGEVDFGSLVASDIERIEVLRGPQSALFGSNAAAGVISIVTKRGAREGVSFRGMVEGGSDGTALLQAGVSGGGETWDAAFGASFLDTAGVNVATGTGDREGERDGDRNVTLNGKTTWDATPDLRLGGNLFFVDRKTDTDSQLFPFPADATTGLVVDTDDVNETTDFAAGVFGIYEMLDDALVHEVNFGYTYNESDTITDGLLSFRTESQRFKAGYQGSYTFETGAFNHLVTGLVEFEDEQNKTNSGFDQTRTLFGVGGEYRLSYGPAAMQASVRQDFNDEFDDALTFSVSGTYLIEATGTRFHSSVGRGVTNPTFFEQFGFSPDFFIGNPDLVPERTFQWDMGVEQTFFDGQLIIDATYFRGKVTDEIVSGFNEQAGLSTTVNATGESPRQGVEVSLSTYPLDDLSIVASYTYTLSQEGSTGLQEVRRPRHLASLDATYRFLDGRARINGNFSYTGKQRDLDFSGGFFTVQPRATLDSYVLLGLQGSYALTDSVEAFARVENALDADYQEVLNFETQGVAGYAGFRVQF
ncbi:TonB-dependent receptor [Rhodobacteraceae bacterium NNCM2]|nr:TonB-dependent receptor [Coraliihabitans acroporae]